MYIAAMGSFDDFSAVFEIKDTVPALITFSQPEYDSTGLPLESVVVGMSFKGKRGEASITIKIKGGSDNPEVTHSLFREIIAKPFKVLFRVLGLPIHALQKLSEESENRQQADQTIN